MTDKNIKKLLVAIGVPADKQQAIIDASNKDDAEWEISDVLDYAKKYAEPFIKPTVEKEAQKAGASGAINKSLKAVYDSIKEDDTPAFEEWKKSVDGKDYADVIKESISASKMKGVSGEDAVKELKAKLDLALKANGENATAIENLNKEWEGKLAKKDFDITLEKTIKGFEKKPLNEKSYKYFLADLQDEGIEIRLDGDTIKPFKKGDVTQLTNDKGDKIISLEEKFNNWATENQGQFVNSAGNQAAGGENIVPNGAVVSNDGKYVEKPGQRKVPLN